MGIIKPCAECRKMFESKPASKRKYCSRECYKLGYSKVMKGHKAWNKGLTMKNHPSIKKIADSNRGRACPHKGKTLEDLHGEEKAGVIKAKLRKSHPSLCGKDSYSWKGDRAKHKATFHQRARRYKKDYCEKCKKKKMEIRNGRLEVHHVDGNIKNNELTNLRTLCNLCHQVVDNRINMKRDWHGRLISPKNLK